MTKRIPILVALVAGLLAFGVAAAYASLAGEVGAGKAVAARVDPGTATCQNLSTADFGNLGAYVIRRMVGSPSAYQAMNSRMDLMIGSQNADLMYRALGRRYAGCIASGMGYGSGMMGGGYAGTGGWGPMMGSAYTWMRNGSWHYMGRAQWQRAARGVMGPGMMSLYGGGWTAGATVLVILGALLLGGLAVLMVLRRPWRQPPSRPSPA